MVEIAARKGGEAGPHHRLGGRRGGVTGDDRAATLVEGGTGAAGALGHCFLGVIGDGFLYYR
jgi:hypothetical protein